jgi:hypothetical protein
LANPYFYAWFRLTGTNKRIVTTETANSKSTVPTSAEIESYTIELPATLSTDQFLRYRIEAEPDRVRFLINGNIISEHFTYIPPPYAEMESTIRAVNGSSTVGSTNTITVLADGIQNINKVNVGLLNNQDPQLAEKSDMENIKYLLSIIAGKLTHPNPNNQTRVALDASSATVTVTAANLQTNVAQFGATNISTGNGVGGTGIPRVTIAADSFNAGTNTVIGAALPIIYNAIAVS